MMWNRAATRVVVPEPAPYSTPAADPNPSGAAEGLLIRLHEGRPGASGGVAASVRVEQNGVRGRVALGAVLRPPGFRPPVAESRHM